MEKGKGECHPFPTLKEDWIQKFLGKISCENDAYNKEIIRNKVKRILIFGKNLEINCKDESKISIKVL